MGFSDSPGSTDSSTSESLPTSSSGNQSILILQRKQETKLWQYKINDFFCEADSDEWNIHSAHN